LINNHLRQIKQWKSLSSLELAIKCRENATALIEMLESEDCGSWGGHDPEDPKCGKHADIYSRYEWLRDRPKNPQ
jgi:hypothetical protein